MPRPRNRKTPSSASIIVMKVMIVIDKVIGEIGWQFTITEFVIECEYFQLIHVIYAE